MHYMPEDQFGPFSINSTAEDPLTWEDSYSIALALRQLFPNIHMEDISLGMIYRWTIALPQFADDPALANESILLSIYQEWFEEVNFNEKK